MKMHELGNGFYWRFNAGRWELMKYCGCSGRVRKIGKFARWAELQAAYAEEQKEGCVHAEG